MPKVNIESYQTIYYSQEVEITDEEFASLDKDDDNYEVIAEKYINTNDVCDGENLRDTQINLVSDEEVASNPGTSR